jgi:hypothetical protein
MIDVIGHSASSDVIGRGFFAAGPICLDVALIGGRCHSANIFCVIGQRDSAGVKLIYFWSRSLTSQVASIHFPWSSQTDRASDSRPSAEMPCFGLIW